MSTQPGGTVLLPVPVRSHKYRVLDTLSAYASAAYAKGVKRAEASIRSILANAHGTAEKGLVIHLNQRGVPVRGDMLLKAERKDPYGHTAYQRKDPRTGKMETIQSKGAKPTPPPKKGRSKPGWYRDDAGNALYLDQPTYRFHTALTDDEVLKTHQHLFDLLEEEGAPSGLWEALQAAGVDEQDLHNVLEIGRLAHEQEASTEDIFNNLTMEEGGDVEEAKQAWTELNQRLAEAVQSQGVQRAINRAHKESAETADLIVEQIKQLPNVDGQGKDWLSKDPEVGALKLITLASEVEAIFIPEKKSDVPAEQRKQWRNQLGRLALSGDMITLYSRVRSRLPAEYNLALSMSAWFAGYSDLAKQFRATAFDQMNVSEEERASLGTALGDRTDHAQSLITAWDSNQGGKSLDKIFGSSKDRHSVLRDDAAVEKLKESDREHAKLVSDALEAQTNEKLPEGGFSKGLKLKLKTYQQQFVNWMLSVKRGINAAEMGLGKTPMTVAMVDHLIHTGKEKRGILVLPPALMAQWPNEIEKFRPGSEVVVIDDQFNAKDRLLLLEAINKGEVKADFVLMSAGIARQYDKSRIKLGDADIDDETGEIKGGGESAEEEIEVEGKKVKTGKGKRKLTAAQRQMLEEQLGDDPWIKALSNLEGAIFYDEAHSESQGLKNPENVSNIVAKHVLAKRKHAMFLTATPIPNEPIDLYNLMDTVHPGSAGSSAARFVGKIAHWKKVWNEEANKFEEKLVGYENLANLHKDIKPFVMIKKGNDPDVASQANLPAIQDTSSTLAMYPEQSPMYERAMSEWFDPPKDWDPDDPGQARRFNMLVKINQMRQAAIHPKLLDPNYKGRGVKIDHTVDLIRKKFHDPKNHDRPVVVFCSYSSAFDILSEELGKQLGISPSQIGRIDSTKGSGARAVTQEAVNAGDMKVILVGIKAGGAGLNLQGVDLKDAKTGKPIIDPKTGEPKHVGPDEVIYIDKPWNPGALLQSRGRVHRIGQRNEVKVNHMRVAGTYDDTLLEKLQEKTKLVSGIENAHKGEDTVDVVAQGEVAKMLKEWASDPRNRDLATLQPEEREKVVSSMKELLGRNTSASGDEAVANMLGFSLKDPDAKKKREAIAKMSVPEIMKQQFDSDRYAKIIEDRAYFQMGKQRLLMQKKVADIKLSRKLMSKQEHGDLMGRLNRGLDVWEASSKAGKVLTKKEMDALTAKEEGPTAMAAYSKQRGEKPPKATPEKPKKLSFSSKAKKHGLKGLLGDLADVAIDSNLTTPEKMSAWLKKQGYDDALKHVEKLYARLEKDGILGPSK